MLAACFHRHGGPDVLHIRELPVPRPRANQWLVRVHAAAVNPKDVLLRAGRFRPLGGLRAPYLSGFDWAGTVVAGGPEGLRLFGMLDGFRGGACAQYVVTDREHCAEVPDAVGFEQAAAVPLVASTSLQAMRDIAALRAGQRVLINGAAGGVGTVAVQIAKFLGAQVHATASARNQARLRELGADEVSDYRELQHTLQSERFDVIFDVFGKLCLADARPGLSERGVLVTTVPNIAHGLDIVRSLASRQRMRLVAVRSRRADLALIADLLSRGALTPVIDRVLPLAEIADAHRHLATKHAQGKVVLRVP